MRLSPTPRRDRRPAEAVFDFATSCEGFPRFLLAFGPIPGIVRAEMSGAAGAEGRARAPRPHDRRHGASTRRCSRTTARRVTATAG